MKYSINPYRLMSIFYLLTAGLSYIVAPFLLSALPGGYALPEGYLRYSCFFILVSALVLLAFHHVVRFSSRSLFSAAGRHDPFATRLYCWLLVAYLLAWVAAGGLTAREEIGTVVDSGSLFYLVRSFEIIPLLALCRIADSLIGLRRQWLTARGMVCLFAGLVFISAGGRGFLVEWAIALLLLYFFRYREFPGTKTLATYGLALIVVFGVVGMLRAEQTSYDGGEAQVFGLTTLDRVGEYATVMQYPRIERLAGTEGFARFERLAKIWMPAFLAADKKTLNDGSETIAAIAGLGDGNHALFPLLFHLDMLLRFGDAGVFAGAALAVALVAFSAVFVRATRKLAPSRYTFIFFVLAFTKVYSTSLLGAINLFLYKCLRDALIVFAISAVVQYFARRRRRHARWHRNGLAVNGVQVTGAGERT